VHEGGFDVQILDDGALRFVRPDGEPVDNVLPGGSQPPGNVDETPVAAEGARSGGNVLLTSGYPRFFLTYRALVSMLFIGLSAKLSPCSTKYSSSPASAASGMMRVKSITPLPSSV
jgi:hypothetical protein